MGSIKHATTCFSIEINRPRRVSSFIVVYILWQPRRMICYNFKMTYGSYECKKEEGVEE